MIKEKKKQKNSLAEKISGILSTTPATFDPEDATDETTAKLLDDSFDENDEDEEALLSKFRKQNVDLLEDLDERYAGKKGSRKDLQESDDDDDDDVSDTSDKEENAESNSESEDNYDMQENDDDGESIENEEESSEDNESDDYDEEGIDLEDINKDESNFSHFKNEDVSAQVKKGLCVRNQMNMWESLLEMRIQLQKCLVTSNKMPQQEVYNDLKKQCGQEFTDKVSETKTTICNVLDKLIQLQDLVLKKYPETKNLGKNQGKEDVVAEDDEEIPSDTEDEVENEESEGEEPDQVPKKRRKLTEYEKILKDHHDKYKNYRNGVIQKWNDKTRIAVAKSTTASHSVLNQIQHTLSDKQRLVKRTQLKRSDYHIVGSHKNDSVEVNNEDNVEIKATEEYNTEIFDDDDFYHQLLRELIEVKSADITDPVQLGRQWIQLQNLRSKMKRKIDTKATKGRKIRYAVHTKLVNFMAPIDENLWSDEVKNEFYGSLFGKKL